MASPVYVGGSFGYDQLVNSWLRGPRQLPPRPDARPLPTVNDAVKAANAMLTTPRESPPPIEAIADLFTTITQLCLYGGKPFARAPFEAASTVAQGLLWLFAQRRILDVPLAVENKWVADVTYCLEQICQQQPRVALVVAEARGANLWADWLEHREGELDHGDVSLSVVSPLAALSAGRDAAANELLLSFWNSTVPSTLVRLAKRRNAEMVGSCCAALFLLSYGRMFGMEVLAPISKQSCKEVMQCLRDLMTNPLLQTSWRPLAALALDQLGRLNEREHYLLLHEVIMANPRPMVESLLTIIESETSEIFNRAHVSCLGFIAKEIAAIGKDCRAIPVQTRHEAILAIIGACSSRGTNFGSIFLRYLYNDGRLLDDARVGLEAINSEAASGSELADRLK